MRFCCEQTNPNYFSFLEILKSTLLSLKRCTIFFVDCILSVISIEDRIELVAYIVIPGDSGDMISYVNPTKNYLTSMLTDKSFSAEGEVRVFQ